MKSTAGIIRRSALIAAAVITSSTAFAALVQPFVPGNLVVDRAGDGSAALTGNGTAIFLDQYTTIGGLVSTVPIPTSGPGQFVDVGNSTTEGFLSLNPFGTNVVLAGYNVPLGTTTPSSANAAAAPRAIATVDNNGIFTLQATSTIAHTGGNIRSAATDGNGNFWASGSVIGTFYMGTNSPTNYISTTVANERVIQVIGGNLYYSTGSGTTRGVYSFSGLPTTTGNTATSLINGGSTNAPFAWSFNPGMNQAYVADSDTFTTSSAIGGIEKWTNNGTSWVFLYSLAPAVDGLCVDWTTSPATIYATTANGSALLKVQDNGPGTLATTNALAPANTAFRSVIFAPTNSAFSPTVAPFLTSVSPTNQTVGNGSTVTFTLNGSTGLPVASNYWYQIIGTTTNQISGQFGSLTLSNVAVGSYSFFAVLSNASGSVTSSVLSLTATPSPVVLGISPATATTFTGGQVTFSAAVNTGTPVASNFWFKVAGGVTNLLTDGTTGSGSVISGSTTTNLTLSNVSTADATNYFIVLTNSFGAATSSVVHLAINDTPSITSISPTGPLTNNAGNIEKLTINTGPAPATNLWFFVSGGVTNLIGVQIKGSGQTAASFTVSNLSSASIGSYFAMLTNTSGRATSAVVAITIVTDPFMVVEPSSVSGLAFGTMQLSAVAGGLQPFTYQWYYSDVNGNLIAPAATMGDGSVVSGANSNVLTLSNWQPADLTNFVLVAQNAHGALTSSVASVFVPFGFNNPGSAELPLTNGVLALWDFDTTAFTNTDIDPYCFIDPVPFIGSGTASAVGGPNNPTTPVFVGLANSPYGNTSGALDDNDTGFDGAFGGWVDTPYGFEQPSPNYAWGTQLYPATNGVNKADGVQFNVSTLGAKNIHVAYDSRVSSTASLYERLQYTTNGTVWSDYPESSTFGKGNFGSGNAGYYTFVYDLTGILGIDNNPNFGVRVVTEWEDTATYYQFGTTNWWVGVANAYTSGASGNVAAGTVSYDVIAIMGDAITNNNTPPVFQPLNLVVTNGQYYTNMVDTNTITVKFSVSSSQMPATNLTVTAQPLGMITGQAAGPGFPQVTLPSKVNPNLSITNTGSTNFTLTISIPSNQSIPDPIDGAPILITATDTNGETASTWFVLSVASANQPPTNSLATLGETNMLANTSLTIPFFVQGANDGTSNLSFVVTSDNDAVIPTANLVLGGDTNTGNLTLTVTPAANQIGNAVISIAVNDTNPQETRSTTANVAFTVRPNTNVIAVDYFNYNGGFNSSLDVVGAPYWTRLSGVFGQLKLGSDVAVINDGNTENVQAPLIGAPYGTNSATVLYASFTVNMNPSGLPLNNGNYFFSFNDGSGNTAHAEGNVVATTNGAAPGMYRLGVGNGGPNGANGTNAQVFAQDLSPGVTYFLVMSLSLHDGISTLWVSPTNDSSASVSDPTSLAGTTNLFNINNVVLRESGATEGIISVGNLTVGTTFDSVFYPPQANPDSFTVAENTSSLLNPLLNDGGFGLSITSVSEVDGNGTPTSNGTNVTFVPTANFIGTATFNYTITDNIGEMSNSVVTVTVTAPTGPTTNANITAEFHIGNLLVIHGTNNNVPNTSFHYVVLSATNLTTPLSNWTPITTNPFNADGTFDYTNPIVPGTPRQFIDVKVVP
ncbi:MAG TPA: cadherin-like domain-containing protein [Verrucomicrobiae bacterium]|nr:cadherin-like domain-containing protein [Verrucomicrobiae bacterium]